ncbi:Ionotropic receptor 129 [Blattella germanica]|nr:Ionotropic receptor 129 [Blattella germanica]
MHSHTGNQSLILEDIALLAMTIQQSLYTDCVFLLHSENSGWNLLNKLINLEKILIKNGRMTNIYSMEQLNHVQNRKKLNYESHENSCLTKRPIYVILAEDKDLFQELEIWPGPLWLLFLNSTVVGNLRNVYIPFNCKLVAVRKCAGNLFVLTEIYQVQEKLPLRQNHLGSWSEGKEMKWIRGGLYHRRNNLQGLKISTAVIDVPGRMTVQRNEKNITIGDLFGTLWNMLERRLNFKMQHSTPEINSWGWMENNGSWNGVIGMIQRGDVHMGACAIFVTSARIETIDFTMPLFDFGYSIFIKQTNPYKMAWDSLISPFSPAFWGICALAMIVMAFNLWMLQTSLNYLNKKNKDLNSIQYTFGDSLFFLAGIFFQQGAEVNLISISERVVLFTASLTAITLYAGYSATLLAYLATDADALSFNNLFEFLEEGGFQLGCVRESAEYFFLRDSKDPILKKAFMERLSPNLPNSNEEAMKMICNSSFAFLAPNENFRPLIKNASCTIIAEFQEIFKMAIAIPIAKNSPYRELFDHSFLVLRDSGVLERLRKENWPKVMSPLEDSWVSVSIDDIVLATTVLATGIVVSIMLLVFEGVITKCKKHQIYKQMRRRKRRINMEKIPAPKKFIMYC